MGIVLVMLGVAIGVGIGHVSHRLMPSEPSATDPLTGALLRDRDDRVLTSLRPGDAIVMLDVDDLKGTNDALGHHVGDALLVDLARHLRAGVRAGDVVMRWGGDEFVLILRDGGPGAVGVVERLRASSPSSFSAGVRVHRAGDDGQVSLRSADAALLAAKRAGGRRVVPA